MSLFKNFGSRRSSSPKPNVPTLVFHVPAYGVVYVSKPPCVAVERLGHGHEIPPICSPDCPELDLRGELEIIIPAGYGGRLIQGIRITYRIVCTFDISLTRKGEQDEILKREAKIAGGEEGIWLEEGSHRFEFNLILPCWIAPHDSHQGARVDHQLSAELIGSSTSLDSTGKSRTWSPFGSKSNSPPMSPPIPRSPLSNPSIDRFSMSFLRPSSIDSTDIPQTPSYEESEAQARSSTSTSLSTTPPTSVSSSSNETRKWLEGVWTTTRGIKICRNPHPDGGITDLDAEISDFVDGWGRFDVGLTSSVLTVGCRMRMSLTIPDPSPGLTIYQIRVSLMQTIELHSPRDRYKGVDPTKRVKIMPILQLGGPTEGNTQRPGRQHPSIWRGVGAHGKDEGPVEFKEKGRLPDDIASRPSTVKDTVTPLVVTHAIIVEVYFSIWGEDAKGNSLPCDGPGYLRLTTVNKPIVLPACPIIPQTLSLPPYETHPADNLPRNNPPCPLCHTPLESKLCRTCPPGPPHPRHDHPPKLVGNPEGICPVCSEMLPSGEVGHRNCMCGMSDADLDKLEQNEIWVNASRVQAPLLDVDARAGGGGGCPDVMDGMNENGKYEFRRGR